ncbi:hypothetical protein TrRE_jg180, partial [Triparma retinervis]
MERNPYDKILSYAQKNDPSGIHEIIKSGCPVLHSNRVGQTSLHIASLWGNHLALSALLSHLPKGSEGLNTKNKIGGSTPLHAAANSKKDLEGRIQCVKLLLSHGAIPSVPDAYGSLPYSYATSPDMRVMLGGTMLNFHTLIKNIDTGTKDGEEGTGGKGKATTGIGFGLGSLGLSNPPVPGSSKGSPNAKVCTPDPMLEPGEAYSRLVEMIADASKGSARDSMLTPDAEGRTVLHCACEFVGDGWIVRFLKAIMGVEGMEDAAEERDNEGRTPGHVYLGRGGGRGG